MAREDSWYSDKVTAKVSHLDGRYSGSPIVVNVNGTRFQIGDGDEVTIPRTVATHLAGLRTVSLSGGKRIEKPVYGVFLNEGKKQEVKEKVEKLLDKPV
jgi:hypothetical protein